MDLNSTAADTEVLSTATVVATLVSNPETTSGAAVATARGTRAANFGSGKPWGLVGSLES